MAYFLLFAGLILASCTPITKTLIDQADQTAAAHGFEQRFVDGGLFRFYAQSRVDPLSREAVVYIEGDGRAWLSRTRPSLNPTPRQPLGLLLATADNHHRTVFYLARPCQFMMTGDDSHCRQKYWTSHRYSEEVVAAYQHVLSQLKQQYQLEQFHLVGFSGGAAIAALLAARRDDIVSLRTVAGNLDTVFFTQLHQVSAMPASLNPADVAAKLAELSQLHFVGSNDSVVPKAIAESYLSAMAVPNCGAISLQGAGHIDGWLSIWPQLLQLSPPCAGVTAPAFND